MREAGGVQNIEWWNVERPRFRNFNTTNIEITKDELVHFFIYLFIFFLFEMKS